MGLGRPGATAWRRTHGKGDPDPERERVPRSARVRPCLQQAHLGLSVTQARAPPAGPTPAELVFFNHSPSERCRLVQGQVTLGPASVTVAPCTHVRVAKESDPGLACGTCNVAGGQRTQPQRTWNWHFWRGVLRPRRGRSGAPGWGDEGSSVQEGFLGEAAPFPDGLKQPVTV